MTAMNQFPEQYSQAFYDLYNSQIPPASIPATNDLQDRFWSGWTGGWGGGGGHGVSNGGGNSPAISALGLLAFLFFLNLIQNSLITNRWLLNNTIQTSTNITTSSVNGGTTLLSGRKFLDLNPKYLVAVDSRLIGKERQKRESDRTKANRTTSDSVPAHPISRLLLKKLQEHLLANGILELIKSQTWPGRITRNHHQSASWSDAPRNCFMFLACKLGRTINTTLGDSSKYMVNALRKYVKVSKKPDSVSNWTFKLVEAFTRGAKAEKTCLKLVRNCKWMRL